MDQKQRCSSQYFRCQGENRLNNQTEEKHDSIYNLHSPDISGFEPSPCWSIVPIPYRVRKQQQRLEAVADTEYHIGLKCGSLSMYNFSSSKHKDNSYLFLIGCIVNLSVPSMLNTFQRNPVFLEYKKILVYQNESLQNGM